MKKDKILEIWYNFNSSKTENEFYSIIRGGGMTSPTDGYLLGDVYAYSDGDGVYHIEISNNRLSDLIVPESLSMRHQDTCVNMTTYRVAVFLVNGRLCVVEGYDKNGETVADWMDGYQRLFTATYDSLYRKWIIPLSDLRQAFKHESPLSTGVNKDLGEHISHLYQLFDWQ